MRNCFGFEHGFNEEKELLSTVHPVKIELPHRSSDEMEQLIFAPDPVTGNPCSSLGALLKSNNEKVREVIRTHFMMDSGTGVNGVDDPDFALKCIKSRSERADEYLNRLAEAFNDNGNDKD